MDVIVSWKDGISEADLKLECQLRRFAKGKAGRKEKYQNMRNTPIHRMHARLDRAKVYYQAFLFEGRSCRHPGRLAGRGLGLNLQV